jgi:hypothetical protein
MQQMHMLYCSHAADAAAAAAQVLLTPEYKALAVKTAVDVAVAAGGWSRPFFEASQLQRQQQPSAVEG